MAAHDMPRRTICVIQARLGSSRLHGKVLETIGGQSMLAHTIERAWAIDGVTDVVVATTTDAEDGAVVEEAHSAGARAFQGSRDDVLDRYYQAAVKYRAEAVVRLTADCPLLDPVLGAEIVANFWREQLDYCSNLIPATHPDGLVVEIVSFKALERSWNEAVLHSDREHVTTYIRTHLDDFKTQNVAAERDYSEVRWTVDRPEDLEVVRRIYALLDPQPGEFHGWRSILRLTSAHPEITALNAKYRRYEGWDRSITADKGDA